MIDHDFQPFPLRQLDQFLRLGSGGGERLFNEDMLAVQKRRLGQLEMGGDRRDDGYDIEIGRRHQLRAISRQSGPRDNSAPRARASRRPRR